MSELLQAIGFIHERGLAYRDIKAENLRIREDGRLKLIGFGLMAQLGVPDTGNHAIRKVILDPGTGESLGDVVTLAGNGSPGCSTGTGTGIALFTSPSQVFRGANNKLYVANTGCNTVSVIE